MNAGEPPGEVSGEIYSAIVDTAGDVIAAEVQRQLSRQLWISIDELKAANRSLQKFTAIVAHDLRGPLRRIEAFVDVLQQDFRPALGAEGADILDRISTGAGRMRLMLDSLLQYSRYSSAAIAGKTANIGDMIADALSVFDFESLEANIRVRMNGSPISKGDPILLSHVLQNLIGNAVKFRTSRPLAITIEVSGSGEEIVISVADNGIGIEPRFADKIFEMFYRLHDDEEYEGAGIGLTICRKIVSDHGGRIWLDTDYIGGTRFIFTLAAASEIDVEAATPQPKLRFLAAPGPHDGDAEGEITGSDPGTSGPRLRAQARS
ncbi:MAG: sensor histidine kinase [Caulobacteraceae bacterium]